jgi:hypothetical protein
MLVGSMKSDMCIGAPSKEYTRSLGGGRCTADDYGESRLAMTRRRSGFVKRSTIET